MTRERMIAWASAWFVLGFVCVCVTNQVNAQCNWGCQQSTCWKFSGGNGICSYLSQCKLIGNSPNTTIYKNKKTLKDVDYKFASDYVTQCSSWEWYPSSGTCAGSGDLFTDKVSCYAVCCIK